MADRLTARCPVVRIRDGVVQRTLDTLVAEEPMEIRVDGTPVSVTMRTPGADFELALGFCLTEGILDDPAAVSTIRYCDGAGGGAGEHNVVDLRRRVPALVADSQRRAVYTTSSCGLCGSASIDAVRRVLPAVDDDPVVVDVGMLARLPAALRDRQRLFDRTGALHAAGLFTASGELVCLREDVGRHNAVDKVVGWAATQGLLPLRGHVLLVSGRVAFEIVQKALYAGVPVVGAVSAPSSLAVGLAADAGMTLIGFLRGTSMNVYSRPQRVATTV